MSSEDAASDAAKGLSDATEASHLMDTRAAPPAEPELQAETAGEMIPTPAYSEVLEEPDYREEERFAAVKYVAPMLVAAVLGAAGMFTYINARPAITPPVPPAKIITDPAPPAKILPPPPIPPPGPAQDEAFATALRDSWITWPRDDDMIDAGHEICLRLSADDDPQQLVDRLIASAADPASHRESAEAIVGAAIKYFCPDDSLATLLHTY